MNRSEVDTVRYIKRHVIIIFHVKKGTITYKRCKRKYRDDFIFLKKEEYLKQEFFSDERGNYRTLLLRKSQGI